jgi:hypothetical protein
MQKLFACLFLFFFALHIATPSTHMFSLEEGIAYTEPLSINHILSSSVVLKVPPPPSLTAKSRSAGQCCSHRHILLNLPTLSDENEIETQPTLLAGTEDLPSPSTVQDTLSAARPIRDVLKNPTLKQLSTERFRTVVLLI